MKKEIFRKTFESPVVSKNGIMTFTLTFQTEDDGLIVAYDRSLEWTIKGHWKFSYDEAENLLVIIDGFKLRKGNWKCLGLVCNAIVLERELKEFSSAYDIIGE